MDLHAVRFIFLLIFVACSPFPLGLSVALTTHNVTINEGDPGIVYYPQSSWRLVNDKSDVDGGHMSTSDPNATATFQFNGTAIYFLSPLFSYLVNTVVSLDSTPPIFLDLRDPKYISSAAGYYETVKSQIVWSATELANRQHTLRISVGPGQPLAIVDCLIYTFNDTPPSAPPASPPSASPASPPSPKRKRVIAAALGAIFGILGLFILLFVIWRCCVRGRSTMDGNPNTAGGVNPGQETPADVYHRRRPLPPPPSHVRDSNSPVPNSPKDSNTPPATTQEPTPQVLS